VPLFNGRVLLSRRAGAHSGCALEVL